ncbi:Signal transducing histidine kinase, homodimeric domain [Marivirga sericea]|uniref:Chemotaxis protein CheA n=1 Tax=Marivirga sericea TaxID=1028 RepID=A0A1X7KEN1_9BACT|nr:chemotaxis protein CheA [Marivirga sericea]SMG39352.1 Signal transducing histidine kinase, homodimeric domain [Marivirga sericea]
MSNKEQEYRKLFISEADANVEELETLLTQLEKSPADQKTIDSIFRIMHTLKGNAAGMGFEVISKFAHALEDLFSEIKQSKIQIEEELFTTLFKAVDTLKELVQSLSDDKLNVRYRGVQRKLEVIAENSRKAEKPQVEPTPTKKGVAKKSVSKAKKSSTVPEKEEKQQLEELQAQVHQHQAKQPKKAMTLEEEKEMITAEEKDAKKISFSDMVQVPVEKLDNLLNLVGELIIERDRLITTHEASVSRNEFNSLKRVSSDLQYSVMDVRLVQVGFLFNKFHRVVRDAATTEKKQVDLVIEGSETEIDRNILQIISDSLIHLIRNAIGHGIESEADRTGEGKEAIGKLTLSARNESEGVVIDIKDDGKGIDVEKIKKKVAQKGWVETSFLEKMSQEEIISFIFEPGFSTNDAVNSISGRGVGMDVVKKAIDSVGGNIKVQTEAGKGSVFSLILPSSMAVKSTLLFEVGHSQYAVPLTYTDAVLSLERKEVYKIQNRLMINHQDQTIETVFLKDLFFPEEFSSRTEALKSNEKWNVVLVHYNGKKLGLVVDKLLQQKEIVEKPLKKPVDFVRYVSGVTILGNGKVCLVINIPQIVQKLFNHSVNVNATAVA